MPAPRLRFALARLTPYLLIAITVAGGWLRFYRIGAKGLWLDESFSVWMGWNTLPDLIAWLLRVDQHPPLYYGFLHFWLFLGNSPAHVRMLSAIFGTLTIPVIFFIGRRLAGSPAGLLAAIILALAPFHVRFAQETRMYALLMLNVALAVLALVYLLSDPRAASMPIGRQFGNFVRTWRAARRAEAAVQSVAATGTTSTGGVPAQQSLGYARDYREGTDWVTAPARRRFLPLHEIGTDLAWVMYMVFTAAAVLTHNTAIFFPIATNLYVLGLIAWRRFVRRPAQPLPVTSGTPAMTPGSPAADRPDFAPPTLSNWLLAQAGAFLCWSPWLVAFVIQSLGVDAEFWIPAPTWDTVVTTLQAFLNAFLPGRITWSPVIWAAYGLLLVLGVLALRKRRAVLGFLLVLFFTPFLGELMVSLRRPIFYDRTLIWTTIPLYLLLALGLLQLRFKPYLFAGLIMLATINLLSLQNYYDNFQKEQWREAAAYVAQQAQPDDVILFNATWVQIPFDYYYRYFNRPVTQHGAPVDLFDRGILEPKMTEADLPRLRSLLRNRDRVWLVYSHDWYTDPNRLIPAALDDELDLVETQQFNGLQILRFEAR